jgi:hypothetical protein
VPLPSERLPGNGGGGGGDDNEREFWFPPQVFIPPVTLLPSSQNPLLWADTYISDIDEPVTLYWNTRNGDESRCTLTGPSLGGTYTPIPHENGTNETGEKRVTITGRSVYTLDCEGRRDSVVLDAIPLIWES